MSLYTTLYTGVTGLNTNSQDLSVTGDNIANANTIGFKQSRAAFEDVLGKSLISGAGETGLGARLQQVQKILTQGALTHTGMATDLALQGKGFFVVDTPDGDMYTRNGQFTIDEDGDLVTLNGLKVQGFDADANGNVSGTMGTMNIGDAAMQPSATTEISIQGNLPSGQPTNPEWALNGGFDINNERTYDFTTSITMYDSLGEAHEATVYFSKGIGNTWEYNVATDGANLEGGTPGTMELIDGGNLEFDGQGGLVNHSQNGFPGFNPLGALQPQTVTFNFGDPADPTVPGMTGNASPFGVRFVGGDGYGAGELASIQFDDEGNVVGAFTNGETQVLGQLAIADFAAPDELMRAGGNLFSVSPGSGDPNIGTAGTGGRGHVVGGALEQSNVDLAGEFVRMIVAQRGFQANSKAINTADQLLGELMQMKR